MASDSWVSSNSSGAPTVILIHGWLGHADSSYVLSAAAHLWEWGGHCAFIDNLRQATWADRYLSAHFQRK